MIERQYQDKSDNTLAKCKMMMQLPLTLTHLIWCARGQWRVPRLSEHFFEKVAFVGLRSHDFIDIYRRHCHNTLTGFLNL